MANLPHLRLERIERAEDRRKRAPVPTLPERANSRDHGEAIKGKLDAAVAEQLALPAIKGIDPELILKVELAAPVQEDAWRLAGFNVLAQEPNNILIVFTDDTELRQFRARLAEYQKGPTGTQKAPPHNGLFACVENVSGIGSADRIGPRLRSEGVTGPDGVDARALYVVDLELWDAPTRIEREVRVQNIVAHIEGQKGEVLSRYVGDVGLIVLRARVRGALLRDVLALPLLARADRPPVPDLGERDPPAVTLSDVPEPVAPGVDAPLIGVIDSGSTDHPLLVPSLAGAIGIPESLGTADTRGHGTKVAGIAAFGDLRECVSTNTFASPVRIVSAKVVNDQGQFDDTVTISAQMQEAVRALHERGCRVINIALGDMLRIPYDGGRVSPWAATLDVLARELDIVVIVTAGNAAGDHRAPWGAQAEHITQRYPDYLIAPENRIVDPAPAALAITVGSLAHANGLPVENIAGAELRAIASLNQPTPVTRSGPGANDAIKPDLVDYGGTCLFDGMGPRVATGHHFASAGMLTLRPDYLAGLLTSATGTSMAAPRIAYKAALLLRAMPAASANMIRSLLALSASVPAEATERLKALGKSAVLACCGYGVPDLARALSSEERRVVLIADHQELATDQFALFRISLPKDFQTTRGKRQIRVSLAFDPPVRHTRLEYLGLRLNYHLIRGMNSDDIFEHFRLRKKGEDRFNDLPGTAKCALEPSRDIRGTSTLQAATFKMTKNIDHYGDDYYLAVFAERRWAGEEITYQRFAISVELEHEAEINIHQQLRARLRA
jgi:subtilisin family serine protease